MKLLSFVIPCYRSQYTISDVVSEIIRKCSERKDFDYEIICVNDGSPDNVWNVIRDYAKDDNRVIGINLNRNFSQSNAQMAGLGYANGDIIVCLDDDGQCPIDRLWDLIAPIERDEGDMTFAKYPQKKQSLFKNFGSRINQYTTHFLLDLPKDVETSNFWAINRLLCSQIVQYTNPFPFITGIVCNATKRIINVPMEERERVSGTTGYTFKKLLHLWMNGFTNFSVVPLRVASFLGVICSMIGFIAGLISVIRKIVSPDILTGYTSIIATVLFVGGIIMLLLGMIGEYVGRIFICINKTPQYVIREVINGNHDKEI